MANEKQRQPQSGSQSTQNSDVINLASGLFLRLWNTNLPTTTEALAQKTLDAATTFCAVAAKFGKQSSE